MQFHIGKYFVFLQLMVACRKNPTVQQVETISQGMRTGTSLNVKPKLTRIKAMRTIGGIDKNGLSMWGLADGKKWVEEHFRDHGNGKIKQS